MQDYVTSNILVPRNEDERSEHSELFFFSAQEAASETSRAGVPPVASHFHQRAKSPTHAGSSVESPE